MKSGTGWNRQAQAGHAIPQSDNSRTANELVGVARDGTGKNIHIAHACAREKEGLQWEGTRAIPCHDEPITTDLRVTVAPAKPGEADASVRLRHWLKIGLRTFGIKAAWGEVKRNAEPAADVQERF